MCAKIPLRESIQSPQMKGEGKGKRKTKTQWLVSKQVQRSLGSGSIGTGLRVQSSAAERELWRIYVTLIFREAFCGVALVSYCLRGREQLSRRGLSPGLAASDREVTILGCVW